MIRPFVLLISIAFCQILLGQQLVGSLQNKRDSLLKDYFLHRDTVTVRTWVNVITSNKYLEDIRQIDSVLLIENSQAVEKPLQMINEMEEEIDQLKKQNLVLESKVKAIKNNTSFQNTTFLFTILVAAIFLILFVVLFFGYSAAKKTAGIRDEESRDYLAKLNEANDEIEKLQITESDLAHKLNLLQSEYVDKIKIMLDEKSFLEDEKAMLENQIIEVKKAYDHEVVKRKEIESELVLAQQQDRLLRNTEEEKHRIMDLEEKLKSLTQDKEEIDRVLNTTLLALEGEVSFRKSAEDSLNSLINQLESKGFMKQESNNLLNIAEEMKTYNQLINDNESLLQQLESLRSDYNNEVKIRRQMSEELAHILSRFDLGSKR
jgi:cbb3-type cytochrome oxidase subunit 3